MTIPGYGKELGSYPNGALDMLKVLVRKFPNRGIMVALMHFWKDDPGKPEVPSRSRIDMELNDFRRFLMDAPRMLNDLNEIESVLQGGEDESATSGESVRCEVVLPAGVPDANRKEDSLEGVVPDPFDDSTAPDSKSVDSGGGDEG